MPSLFVSLRGTAKQSQHLEIASFHSVLLAMTNVQLILRKYVTSQLLSLMIKNFLLQNRSLLVAENSMNEVTMGSDFTDEYYPTIPITKFTAYQ